MPTRYTALPSRKLADEISQFGIALGWGSMQQSSFVWNDWCGSTLDYTNVCFSWTSKSYRGLQLDIFSMSGAQTVRQIQERPAPFAELKALIVCVRLRLYVDVTIPAPSSAKRERLVNALQPLLGFDNFVSPATRKHFFLRFPECQIDRLRPGETFFPTSYRLVRGKFVANPPRPQEREQREHFAKLEADKARNL